MHVFRAVPTRFCQITRMDVHRACNMARESERSFPRTSVGSGPLIGPSLRVAKAISPDR